MKNLLEKVEISIAVAKESFEWGKSGKYIPPSFRKYGDIHIYTSCGAVATHVGVPSYIPMAMAIGTSTDLAIVVNRKFDTLKEEYREAILAHEEGHIALDHIEELASRSLVRRLVGTVYRDRRLLEIELEADLYALEKGLPIKDALLDIKGYINSPELEARIQALP